MQQRTDPLDTNPELLAEIKESLDSIVEDVDEITIVLRESDLEDVVQDLDEEELHSVLHRLFDLAPDDVKSFANAVEAASGENLEILRKIVYSVAQNGLLPEEYIDSEISQVLFSEVYANDPEYIQNLNKIERIADVLALRYRLQQLLLSEYYAKHPNAPEFELDDLVTSDAEDNLEEQLELARQDTSSNFEDYLAEYQLGVERKYEREQQIFLAKKVIYIGKAESKTIPDEVFERLKSDLEEYNSRSYNLQKLDENSTDPFSFHQIKIMGGVYNFGYFDAAASRYDFFDIPKLDPHKRVLVLLHGMSRDWAYWRKMLKLMLPHYQIIAPDMNGYADSDELIKPHTLENYSNYVAAFLNKLGVKEFDIMGHSLGSFTTQQVLMRADLRPRKGILFSSSPFIELPTLIGLVGNLTKAFSSDLIGKIMANIPSSVEGLGSIHDKEIYKEDDYYDLVSSKTSARAISEAIKYIAFEYNFEDFVIPEREGYLVVAAEKDNIISPATTAKFTDFIPNSEFILMPGVGHDEVVNRFIEQYEQKLLDYMLAD